MLKVKKYKAGYLRYAGGRSKLNNKGQMLFMDLPLQTKCTSVYDGWC